MTLHNVDRRTFIRLAGAGGLGAFTVACQHDRLRGAQPVMETGSAGRLVRFPEKAELILLTDRAPQLETPLHYFRQDLTPNEAYFVRWHLAGIPTFVDTRTFRLKVGGLVRQPLELSLDDLRQQFEPVSLIALNQCSGNSRSFFEPRVAGGQWKHGAMGNSRWTGVRLKDLLDKAGVKAGAVDVTFGGLDEPPLPSVNDFVKSLDVEHARDGEVMVAYEMNGAPPPMLNGFPLRLIVPGWYATYWVKALDEITVLPEKFKGFWMEKAYRIPNNSDANESHDNQATDTVPINRFSVRSIFVRPEPDEHVAAGHPFEIEGLAFDSGYGIRRVEVSTDGGASWADAQLDPELGKYSWRRWRFNWTPHARGAHRLLARATNAAGDMQRAAQWNHGGYMRNVVEHTDVIAI